MHVDCEINAEAEIQQIFLLTLAKIDKYASFNCTKE